MNRKFQTVLMIHLGMFAVAASAAPDEPPASDPSELVAEAQASVAAFSSVLKAELVKALQDGGPTHAIAVCSTEAPAIAQRISLERGVKLSRVALRNRNPDNAPNRWQKPVLESFEARRAAGEDPAKLTWTSLAPAPGGTEFRYLQAIPTGALCLQCHGENIDPAVAGKIAEIYPGDQATGFKEGDIRGAFVVTRR